MPIVYCCVERSNIILADLALRGGRFQEAALSFLRPLPFGALYRRSIQLDGFRYHILSEDGVSYVCVTELSYESRRAHEFLNQICSFFANSPLIKKAAFAQPYEFSSDLHQVLGQLMADYSSQQPASSKLESVQGQVNEVKVILKDNINKVLERGERLDDLVDKTHDLQATADSFQRTSTRVARKYWWKNTKMMIIIGVIVLIILILIILFATGVIPS
uniref:vesicle-associated membrane protein 7 isoform X1 n=2 Tax=Oncorhynchus gorbuscha TaxID=8017 RepID=UPI001EAEC8F4|nr:vesicle-associated membrane protein 7 isoform X1 [Oncorhynchus gorbuscha]XP_046225590.1 vesicle-associated membrane protein 7 isoform X1 [Oncorhynchus gorbuscha]XP_046225591.1 vesicle-associated membrane protein 7 isoform X1 [Oncorhynchus gorbuscha]